MKIKVIITMILMILLSACGSKSKDQKSDVKILGLKGKVKSIKYMTYNAELKFGAIKKGEQSNSKENNKYFNFNENEIKIEDGEYISYDQIQIKRLYIYNDKNILTQTSGYNLNGDFLGKLTYEIDSQGDLIETNDFNSKNEFMGKTIYTRDNNGNAIETNIYDSMGNLKSKFTSDHDSKGRILESIYYDSNGELLEKKYIKYDNKGRIIERKLIIDTSIFIQNFKYDNKETDDLTVMIKSENYSIISETIYTYKYDKNGNWIEKISIEDEVPKIIVEREIEYYM